MPGSHTKREAVSLASFCATLLAPFLTGVMAAGALTGAAYAWLIELWDGMLKNQAKSKTAALMERPFAWFV